MRIQKLPVEARSKLQSGMIVTDAVQCVLELVHNSLDAGATGVAVRIDLKKFQIKVIDNGKGIARDDFDFVGERYMTSKYHAFNSLNASITTYGFKGQAISSLLDVCKSLTIETKSENEGPTFIKVFQNNKALPITEVDNERRGTGTTVTVEDFMCTMPVRRKRINEVFDNEEIKTQLQYLAIIHYNVCFTLRNENKGLILLQTSQASNMLQSLSNIFGSSMAKSLRPVLYSDKKYEIAGYVGLKTQNQNNVHLVYINKRIITKGVIHKFIKNLMKEYRDSKTLLTDSRTEQSLVLKKPRNFDNNAFIVQINCPYSYYELFTSLRKTTVEFKNWKEVLKCVHKAVRRAFKLDDKSLDSSLNTVHNKEKNNSEDGINRKFGTSLLVNAVRGAPVKRRVSRRKDVKKQKKRRSNENKENLSFSKEGNKTDNCQSLEIDSKRKTGCKEFTNHTVDSLESPIPKNHFKLSLCNIVKRISPKAPNHSLAEFCDWLQTKFKTDPNVFSLYNDFLQSKKKEALKQHSPVLHRGEKRSKKLKAVEEKRARISPRNSKADDLLKVSENQFEKFPPCDIRIEKAVQFFKGNTPDMSCSSLKRKSGMNHPRMDSLNFEMNEYKQIFKKPTNLPPPGRNHKQSLFSPASSEVQFTNIIKFRNFSENFIPHYTKTQRSKCPETKFCSTATSSWTSHYQELGHLEAFGKEQNKENYFSYAEGYKSGHFMKNCTNNDNFALGFEVPSYSVKNMSKFGHAKERVNAQDAEIQVNMSGVVGHSQKVSAAAQTSGDGGTLALQFEDDCIVSESPSFNVNDRRNNRIRTGAFGFSFDKEFRNVETVENSHIFSQEVPAPDFWNTSTPGERSNHFESFLCRSLAKISSNVNISANEKISSISEPIYCGQKANSTGQTQIEGSLSKETQTHAALWPQSLIEIVNTVGNLNSASLIECAKSDGTQLPKTLPLEELDCDFTAPTEGGFSLTERHEFVPKGLSPKFLNTEASAVFTLSPREKSRIKLTIGDVENELLATVKWHDELTGISTKPTIPGGILCEIREKTEGNVTNHQNRILSGSLSYCAIKVHNLLHSFAFTKELLAGVEILGQLDKKFIVTKMEVSGGKKMELISLFDQHAVDERIKLEELINGYITPDGKFTSSSLNPPVECIINESDVRVISDQGEKMENFGLSIETINENTISFHAVPTFMLNKHEKDLKNGKDASLEDILKALILDMANELRETRGAASKIPKIIHNAFCLEACHSAIKFNRMLTKEDMVEMINKLKNCKLPFQCAHGRPSVIPIIDLMDFRPMMTENENLDIGKLKRFVSNRNNQDRILSSNEIKL